MKMLASLHYLLCFCLLSIIFSCTKTNNEFDSSMPAISGDKAAGRLSSLSAFAPGDSLVIRGDTSMGDQTALIQTPFKDNNINNFVSFTALNSPLSGNGGLDRLLMKFSLRGVTDTSVVTRIKKVLLYLYQYHRPADIDPYRVSQTNDNSVLLRRVITHWDASTVTWNTQPKVAAISADTSADVVVIPAVITPLPKGTNDNQALDITAMVKRMIITGNNEGFMMILKYETSPFELGRAYGSLACPLPARRPKLVIYF